MSSHFDELGVPAPIVRSLHARGIDEPFPIQTAALPAALEGRDLCGKAPTGSGKTIAFGIPLAARCAAAVPKRPTGLVLVPTRELAEQVATELRLLAAPIGLTVDSFYGGVSIERQTKALRTGIDLAVACPGRLRDLLDRGAIRLDRVQVVVVDEADRMADMGFLPEVRRLLDETPSDRQTLLFSATLDGDIDVLIQRYQQRPVRVEVARAAEDAAGETDHHFWSVARDRRLDTTAEIIRRLESAIVFTRTRHGADRVAEQLSKRGVPCAALHGDKSQKQRDRALDSFRNGEVHALVATDVAARGIHIDSVAGVIQYDTPADHKDYTHRAGRTARAGTSGVVITLVTPESRKATDQVLRDLGRHATVEAAAPHVLGPVLEFQAAPSRPEPRPERPGPSDRSRRKHGDDRRPRSEQRRSAAAAKAERARAVERIERADVGERPTDGERRPSRGPKPGPKKTRRSGPTSGPKTGRSGPTSGARTGPKSGPKSGPRRGRP